MTFDYLHGDDVRGLLHLLSEAHELIEAGRSASAHSLAELSRILDAQIGCSLIASLRLGPACATTPSWSRSSAASIARRGAIAEQHAG